MSPPPVLAEPDAERTEALLLEPTLGLARRYDLRLRVPALGEVPEPLPAAASHHGDLAVQIEDHEHAPDVPVAEPAVVAGIARGAILELPGEQRPALFERAHHVAAEGGVLLQKLVPPAIPQV